MNHKHDTRVTPCLQHPGDWFDPKRRTFTRQGCLTCPNLLQCSQSALRTQPSYGMWAGVWIDGDFPNKKHLLGAHACPAADAKTLTANPSHHRHPWRQTWAPGPANPSRKTTHHLTTTGHRSTDHRPR